MSNYGFTRLTIVCMLFVLALLPYSLCHKLHLTPQTYSLGFVPSFIVTTIMAQEKFVLSTVIGAAVIIIFLTILIVRKKQIHTSIFFTNFAIIGLILIYTIWASNTNILTHFKYKIAHYISLQDYTKALSVGETTLHIDSTVFNLRAQAMIANKSLPDDIFRYPIPKGHNTITYTDNNTSYPDITLCNLLLHKDLKNFVEILPQYYDINSETLPRHYKEALIVYMAKTIHTPLTYSDPTTLANYTDFINEMKKHHSPQIRSNRCRDLYGDSYFWYYTFFPL